MKKIPLPIVIFGWILSAFGVFAFLSCFSIVGDPSGIIGGFKYTADNASHAAAWMIGGRSLGQAVLMIIGLLGNNRRVLAAGFAMGAITELGDLIAGIVYGVSPLPMLVVLGVFVVLEAISAYWLGFTGKDA
jgi:hypothetical protein